MLLCCDSVRAFTAPFPWKKIVDLIDRVIGDAGDDIRKPGFRVDVIEARGFDQRIDDRRPSPAFVGAGEQIVFSTQRQGPDR